MLETKKVPISTRTRRMDPLPRTQSASRRASGRSAQPETVRLSTFGNAQVAPRPAPLPQVVPSRLGRSEARLMGIAVMGAVLVCGLIVLYVAAYARVTLLGIDQSHARGALHQDRQRNEMLRAECDSLQSPNHIAAAAAALGMTTRGDTPVQYIAPAESHDTALGRGSSSDWTQGINGGTTADIRTTASFNH